MSVTGVEYELELDHSSIVSVESVLIVVENDTLEMEVEAASDEQDSDFIVELISYSSLTEDAMELV